MKNLREFSSYNSENNDDSTYGGFQKQKRDSKRFDDGTTKKHNSNTKKFSKNFHKPKNNL